MSLRVLHVLSTDDRRGAESFAMALSSALRSRGWSSTEAALARGHGEAAHDLPVLGTSRLGVRTLLALRTAARAADVVVAHGSSTLPACAVALLGSSVPFVYVNIGDPLYWASSRRRRFRVRRLLRRADHVAAISHGSRKTLVDHFDVDAGKVSTIPNGRSAAEFPLANGDSRRMAREQFGLPADADVVIYLGALSPEKRADLAVEAIARLDGVLLLVVGGGPLRGALEEQASEQAAGRVFFAGQSDAPSLALSAADVLVLPSDSEGLPGVLIEAGLTGIPAVATDVGWVAEVIREGETGFVVPRGRADDIARRLGDALAQRRELGAAARVHCAREFDMSVVVAKWEAVLRATASRRKR